MRLIRDGEKGGGVWEWGERESIYLSLHCHHQNDSCIKMRAAMTAILMFYLIVRDKVTTRLCPQTTTFLMKKGSRSGIEPRPLCFKPAHKPSCRPPLVIPPDKSGKGAGLWMGPFRLAFQSAALTHVSISPGFSVGRSNPHQYFAWIFSQML